MFTARSVILAWPHLSRRGWVIWWREWTSIDFTLTTVSKKKIIIIIWFCVRRFQRLPFPASAFQKQQAHPHHHPQPARAHHRRRRRLHRLHPPDAVCWRTGPPALQPVRRDQSMAPPGEPVAERPLPLLRSPCCPAAGLRWAGKDAVNSLKLDPNQPITTMLRLFSYPISRCATLPRRGGGKEAGTGPEREAHSGPKGFGIAVVLSTLLSSLSFCPRQTLTLPSPRPTLQQRTHLSVWKQPPVSFSWPVRGCSPTLPDSIRAPLPSKICPFSPPRRYWIVIFCSCYHSCGLSVCFLTCTVYFLFIFDLWSQHLLF